MSLIAARRAAFASREVFSTSSPLTLPAGPSASGSLHCGQRLAKPGLSGFNSNSSSHTTHVLIGNAIPHILRRSSQTDPSDQALPNSCAPEIPPAPDRFSRIADKQTRYSHRAGSVLSLSDTRNRKPLCASQPLLSEPRPIRKEGLRQSYRARAVCRRHYASRHVVRSHSPLHHRPWPHHAPSPSTRPSTGPGSPSSRAADIPGENTIVHLTKDHPCLAAEFINHPAEPILLLAHPEKPRSSPRSPRVHITYEEFPGVFTIEDSEAAAAGDESEDHLARRRARSALAQHLQDIPDALRRRDRSRRRASSSLRRSRLHRRRRVPNRRAGTALHREQRRHRRGLPRTRRRARIASASRGSMQCPYYLVHALELVFNLPADKCRVIQTETGGAFGGKEDFPSRHRLARCSARDEVGPSRQASATTAPKTSSPLPSAIPRARAIVLLSPKDGNLLGGRDRCRHRRRRLRHALAGRPLARHHPRARPYHWPHLRVYAPRRWRPTSRRMERFVASVRRNLYLRLERHMDKIARTIGLTPEEFRRRNFLATGMPPRPASTLSDQVDMQHLLTRALKESNYHAEARRFDRTNPTRPSSAASASQPSCTAPASPAPASAGSTRWS